MNLSDKIDAYMRGDLHDGNGLADEARALETRIADRETEFLKQGGIADLEKRVAELDRSEAELIDQRDRAEGWADKLAEAIARHFREDIGEHSNVNNPWAEALNLISGTFCR